MEVDNASGGYAIVVLYTFPDGKYLGPKAGQLYGAPRLRYATYTEGEMLGLLSDESCVKGI